MLRSVAAAAMLALAAAAPRGGPPACDHAFVAGDEVVAAWVGPNDDGLLPDLRAGEVFTVLAVREGTGGLRLAGRPARSGYFRADRFCRLQGMS